MKRLSGMAPESAATGQHAAESAATAPDKPKRSGKSAAEAKAKTTPKNTAEKKTAAKKTTKK